MYRAVACLFFTCAAACGADAQPWPLWDGQETVEQYAKRTNLPPTKTLDLGNGVNLELVLIPAGKFIMGTPEPVKPQHTVAVGQAVLGVGSLAMLAMALFVAVRSIRKRQRPQYSLLGLLGFVFCSSVALYGGIDWWQTSRAWREYEAAVLRYESAYGTEKPAHEVTLTKPWYMGKYEVTQEQYQQVTGTNPSHFKGANLPVGTVSWDNATEFCKAVTRPSGSRLDPEDRVTVRLPTEAEWEYACRAGTTTTYYTGDTEADLRRAAWYSANSNNTTHPVGQKEPNPFRLYDMHGNALEWCLEYEHYSPAAAVDPQGPIRRHFSVLRGGSWHGSARDCRSAYRIGGDPGYRDSSFGFRVVVEVPPRTP